MVNKSEIVKATLTLAWQRATEGSSPVVALRASRDLYRQLSAWQSVLAAQALAGGATWEEIGEALGTTRQAAWSRFKDAIDTGDRGGLDMDKLLTARREAEAELAALYEQLKTQDQTWREERDEVRARMQSAQESLRSLSRERSKNRRAILDTMKDKRRSLREQLGAIRSEVFGVSDPK